MDMRNGVKGWNHKLLAVAAFALPFMALAERVDWATAEVVAPGVKAAEYKTLVPRLMECRLLRVDLRQKGLSFVSTGRAKEWGQVMPDFTNRTVYVDTAREKTETFMRRLRAGGTNVVAAVNTTPWSPWQPPWNHRFGRLPYLTIADGQIVSRTHKPGPMLVIRKDNTAVITNDLDKADIPNVALAHPGFAIIMRDGKVPESRPTDLAPRTAFGLSADKRYLYVLIIDGRQPDWSQGADMSDVARLLKDAGASDALNVDGGGSTTLVTAERDGKTLKHRNRHEPKYSRYRPVALNLGIVMDEGKAEKYQPEPWNLEARAKFADARFGIFIVFGLYSNYSQGEWYLHHPDCRNDPESYERMIDGFYPSKYDAREWARIVKDSGAKYITITARHHDGFALWPSKVDDWNVKNTPFKRDIIGELDRACQAEGIQLNLYYSLLDWHRADYTPGGACRPVKRPRQPDYASYKKYMMGQIDELCTNYHPGNIWFDGEWDHIDRDRGGAFDWGFDDIFDLIHSHKVLIINNNHKNIRDKEDIQTFERDLPGEGTAFSKGVSVAQDRPLEQSDVLQKNVWGYRIGEHNFLTPEQVVAMTVKCAARNSNMLMNVGPDGSGRFPRQCVEILAAVGKWFRANGDSVYGTRAGGVELGRGQVVSTRKGGTLYLHFLDPAVKEFSFLVDGVKRTVSCPRAKDNGYDVVVPVEVGDAAVANLPPCPGTKVTWKVVSCTCDNPKIPGKPQCAIDGNPRSLWHSHPEPFDKATPLPPPQSIVVDCTAAIEMKGFTYTPRLDGCPNGLVDLCEFQVSDDGKNWTLAARAEFKDIARKPEPQKVAFAHPVKARYFRFTACRAIPPNDRIAVGEIDVW